MREGWGEVREGCGRDERGGEVRRTGETDEKIIVEEILPSCHSSWM